MNTRPLPYQGSALPLSYGSEIIAEDAGDAPETAPKCHAESAIASRLPPGGVPGYRSFMRSPKKSDPGTSRDERRAKALRENLKRRKAQAKGRAQAEDAPGESGDSGKDSNHSPHTGEE